MEEDVGHGGMIIDVTLNWNVICVFLASWLVGRFWLWGG
jgi:hypothetical protein